MSKVGQNIKRYAENMEAGHFRHEIIRAAELLENYERVILQEAVEKIDRLRELEIDMYDWEEHVANRTAALEAETDLLVEALGQAIGSHPDSLNQTMVLEFYNQYSNHPKYDPTALDNWEKNNQEAMDKVELFDALGYAIECDPESDPYKEAIAVYDKYCEKFNLEDI